MKQNENINVKMSISYEDKIKKAKNVETMKIIIILIITSSSTTVTLSRKSVTLVFCSQLKKAMISLDFTLFCFFLRS